MLLAPFAAGAKQDRARALALLDRIVEVQAALLSYADLFFYVAVLFIVTLPLLLLLGDSHRAPPEAEAAH